jgi:hypothetical protein
MRRRARHGACGTGENFGLNGRILDEPECEIVFFKQKFHCWSSSAGEPLALPVQALKGQAKKEKGVGLNYSYSP